VAEVVVEMVNVAEEVAMVAGAEAEIST